MAEPDARRTEVAEAFDGPVVGVDIGGRRPAFERRGHARPLGSRVASLAGQDDQALGRADGKRLVTGRMTRGRHDRDVIGQAVVAVELLVAGPFEIDPFEDRVVGRVRDLPLGGLHVDRDAGERSVLAGVIGMQVAVRDGIDLGEVNAGREQRVRDGDRPGVVPLFQLDIAEAKPGIEQEQAAAVTNQVADDDTLEPGSSFGKENVPSSSGTISARPMSVMPAHQDRRVT